MTARLCIYLLEASFALALLYLFCRVLVRSTTFYTINRYIYLLGTVLTLLLPFISEYLSSAGYLRIDSGPEIYVKAVTGGSNGVNAADIIQHTHKSVGSITLMALTVAYGLGFLYFLGRLLSQLSKVLRIIRTGRLEYKYQVPVIVTTGNIVAFSFLRWIVINPARSDPGQLDLIIAHEDLHVRQRHTLDILWMEFFTILFWFHPLAWKLKEMVVLNLEYLADSGMLKTGIDARNYQYALIGAAMFPSVGKPVNYFSQSRLGKRIDRMNTMDTPRYILWRYLLFVPALVLVTVLLAPLNAQNRLRLKASGEDIYLVISKDVTPGNLDNIQNYLHEEGIEISFSGIRYTADHQLSGITVNVTIEGETTVLHAPPAGTVPVSDPVIFYLLRSKNNEAALVRQVPGNIPSKSKDILKTLNGFLKLNPQTGEFDLHGSVVLNN
jgi:hypothetical protein